MLKFFTFILYLQLLQITLSKHLASDTGVTMTVTLRPAVSVPSGSKLVITLVARPLSGLPSPPLTSVIAPSQGAAGIISSSRIVPFTASEIEVVFGAEISANTLLTFSFGTFALPANAFSSSAVDAAIVDGRSNNVIAASSQGTFPAIFSTVLASSSVSLSSSVANAAGVTVSVTFYPSAAITSLRLTGLTFVAYAGAPGNRRLLQSEVSCTNLAYSGVGALSVTYDPVDGDLSLSFPGGSASRISQSSPCICQISGFRNPAAASASPGIMVTTYDTSNIGSGMQSGVVFPPILCEKGYLQSSSNNVINCAPCTKGLYNELPGAAQCLQCPSGTYGNSTAAVSMASCTPCPPTTFSDKTGASDAAACSRCPPGTNSSVPGAVACAPCAAGSYAESQGQLYCDLCQAGYFGSKSRASSKDVCVMCPAGTYSKNGSMICTRCAPGTSSKEGSRECQPCLAGEYSESGDCIKCPGISYSLKNGSASVLDCSGVLVGGRPFAATLGIVILFIYILSFSLVPSWTAADTVMRFEYTANFDGRLGKNVKTTRRKRTSSWTERASSKIFKSSNPLSPSPVEERHEKRFFQEGDEIRWEGQEWALEADAIVGTVESTTVYPEQDADELGDFDVFVKIHPSFEPMLQKLEQAAVATGGEKPVMFDSKCRSCRCQLKSAPASHASMPLFGWRLGRWEIMRQINACFQLLLMSLFPAIDTISDLVYILSSEFASTAIFAVSLFFLTSQFWLYMNRLRQRHVFKALMRRRVDLAYLKGRAYWPKWASPDSLPVFLTMILPFYFVFHVVFPIVWFLLGYALYSFQLFPISRISNRWLYAFVCVFLSDSPPKLN